MNSVDDGRTCCHTDAVFVFGSNEAGIHGAGAARHAVERHGAQYGNPRGRQGGSYAIPTKDAHLETLPLTTIGAYVAVFLLYAAHCPEETFYVTRIGCGYAGYTDTEIAPLFAGAPENCLLPNGWSQT